MPLIETQNPIISLKQPKKDKETMLRAQQDPTNRQEVQNVQQIPHSSHGISFIEIPDKTSYYESSLLLLSRIGHISILIIALAPIGLKYVTNAAYHSIMMHIN